MANKSLNQIISLFQEVAEKHKQINSFYFGSFLSAMKEENITYPILVVDALSVGIDRNQLNLNLIISVADKVFKDHDNMNEVQSDTLQIVNDITMTLESDKWKAFSNVSGTSQASRFIERGLDEVTGWAMNLGLQITSKKDLCQIPFDNYDFDGDYLRGCDPVKIFEDGILVDTVESGGSYSYSSGGVTCDDGTVNINKSDSSLIAAQTVASGGTENYNVADSNVSNSDDTYSVNVKATENLELPDITHTDSDGSSVVLPAQTPFVATSCPSSDLAKPLQTGQTTSYISGDDGDTENGRLTDFFTLTQNNSFGNTNRFTDTAGGQTYANDVVIDHATGFKWYRIDLATELGMTQDWEDCINNASNVTADGGGWRAPNVKELMTLANFETNTLFEYAPFNYVITGTGSRLWTSTTYKINTARAYYYTENGYPQFQGKTNLQTTLVIKNA